MGSDPHRHRAAVGFDVSWPGESSAFFDPLRRVNIGMERQMAGRTLWPVATILALFWATPALAADGEDESDWQFAVTPYLWASGASGDVELAEGESVEVETSFLDVLEDLKFAGMVGLEGRHERVVLIGDLIYLSLGTESEGPLGFVDAEVDTTIFAGTAAVGYRLVDKGPLFLDLLAGGRVTSLDVQVALTGPLQTVERERSKSSIAPVVGARFRAPLGGRFGFAVYGDIGGFGANTNSWQLLATIHYDFNDRWRSLTGYRHVEFHVDQEGFEVDLALSGPIFGLSYRF
jgi:hypothetical protein